MLSDSSEAYPRGDQLAQHQSVRAITDPVLVSQEEIRVELSPRRPDGKWLLSIPGPGTNIDLASIGVVVDVERVSLKAPRPPPAGA